MTSDDIKAALDRIENRLDGFAEALARPAPQPEYVDLKGAAVVTGFGYDYLHKAVTVRRDLPAVKKGREWRVALADLRKWMEKDRVGQAAPSRSDVKKKVARYLPGVPY